MPPPSSGNGPDKKKHGKHDDRCNEHAKQAARRYRPLPSPTAASAPHTHRLLLLLHAGPRKLTLKGRDIRLQAGVGSLQLLHPLLGSWVRGGGRGLGVGLRQYMCTVQEAVYYS